MGQINFTISLIFIALFTVAILGFAIQFASDNGTTISIEDKLGSLRTNEESALSDFRGESEDTYQSIIESSIETGDTTVSGGQFALTPLTLVSTVYNILDVGWIEITGGDENFAIFSTTLLSLIGIILGMYVWKTWRGNPD